MNNKFGEYIIKLMTTVIDDTNEKFVKDLAINELNKLKTDIEEFIRKHKSDDSEQREKTEKQLLQEEK